MCNRQNIFIMNFLVNKLIVRNCVTSKFSSQCVSELQINLQLALNSFGEILGFNVIKMWRTAFQNVSVFARTEQGFAQFLEGIWKSCSFLKTLMRKTCLKLISIFIYQILVFESKHWGIALTSLLHEKIIKFQDWRLFLDLHH